MARKWGENQAVRKRWMEETNRKPDREIEVERHRMRRRERHRMREWQNNGNLNRITHKRNPNVYTYTYIYTYKLKFGSVRYGMVWFGLVRGRSHFSISNLTHLKYISCSIYNAKCIFVYARIYLSIYIVYVLLYHTFSGSISCFGVWSKSSHIFTAIFSWWCALKPATAIVVAPI